jgi:hypothetical protein
VIYRDPKAVKGEWKGDWIGKDSYKGVFTTKDGRRFEGTADWLTERLRDIHATSGDIIRQVAIPMTPCWEFTGTFIRRDGKGATGPFAPIPPEERDDGEPPPEELDEATA